MKICGFFFKKIHRQIASEMSAHGGDRRSESQDHRLDDKREETRHDRETESAKRLKRKSEVSSSSSSEDEGPSRSRRKRRSSRTLL